jgi:hypothetical protein
MNIVIPTYNKHYKYNINFLESFRRYCLDRNDVKINFIVSSNEYDLFNNLKSMFLDLNIFIVKFSDLLYNIDGKQYPDTEKFFSDKYPLQSLKKLLAFSCVDTDYVVFDSENLCLKPFNFRDIFSTLKNKPILYCDNTYQDIQKNVISSCNLINNFNTEKWFFLKSYWFYELEHVRGLIDDLREMHNKDIFILLSEVIFFEYQLYCGYLYKNNLKEFLSTDELLSKTYDFKTILDNNKNNYEFINGSLTEENVDYYIQILNDLDERVIRLHWLNVGLKDKIIEKTNVSIGTFHWD